MSIPDNYSIWAAHEQEKERRLSLRPVCDICENHIQDAVFYEIDCKKVCEECLNLHFRRAVEEI